MSPCGISPAEPVPVHVIILNPCLVPIEAPVGVIVPALNPAAAALA